MSTPVVYGGVGAKGNGLGTLGLGGPQPLQSFALPAMATTALPYMAHLYDHNLVFKQLLGASAVINKPGLKLTTNGGYQPITLEVAKPVSGIVLGDVIRLTEQGDSTGTWLFSGNVETTPEELAPTGTHHLITVTPWVAELGDAYFHKNYSTATDVAQFVRDAIAGTGHCSVSPISCPDTGIKAMYDFQNTTALDAIHVAKQIAGGNYFWFVNPQGVVYFQPMVTVNPATVNTIAKLQTGVVVAGLTPTLPLASTAGSCLVAFIGFSGSGTFVSAAPTGWTKLISRYSAQGQNLEVWACPNAASVSSAAFTVSGAYSIPYTEMSEWSNVLTVSALDTSGSAEGNNLSQLAPATTGVVTQSGDVALTGWYLSKIPLATVTFTTPTGWTRLTDNGATSDSEHIDIEYLINPPTGTTLGPTLTCSVLGNSSGAIVCLKPSITAGTTRPATITLKKGVDYNSTKPVSTIVGMRNKIIAVGGSNPGDPGRIKSTYDGVANQALYGVRSFNPTLSYPTVTDQATLNAVVTSLGSQFDRVLNTVELELPNLGTRLTPDRAGGLTVRLFEPSVDSLQESSSGSGTYSPTYCLRDCEMNGASQRIIIGDIPFTDIDTAYEATRIAQRVGIISATATPAAPLTAPPPPPAQPGAQLQTVLYDFTVPGWGLLGAGGGVQDLGTVTFTTPRAGTCQIIGQLDCRMDAWDNYVGAPRRDIWAEITTIVVNAHQELPFGITRATYSSNSASGIAIAAGTYTARWRIDTEGGNNARIYSGWGRVVWIG